ncbi:energy-coupling factor transport system ATP-binding protein [Salirhabdus euzebyi]|uniref:Energy-coupling factor transporter ATP-binding protein EcfA2 n=1 Tax=Salirhabdus euzebyi TaxID=394506 RepID=A0A841Q9T3_9BACI|nr:energy-coupling factor ABC transporter ATP-binding protein [Salirhabdus euzebyi]MBB6455156.1 energy-coupling factor transport system ATP-binding protein [Salirhabdus euzebyi]
MDIIFNKVSHIYQPNTPFEFKALENVSFHIQSGSYVAIIGHTGSGKSTLIQHLNGLVKPTSGEVKIGDYVITPEKKLKDVMTLREKVGIVFQYPEHQLFEETVEKDISFGPQNFNIAQEVVQKRIPELLKAVQLPENILQRSPFDLSGGQMRRVAIAGVLVMDPKILVLDEPTAGLDPRGQKEIMDMFYRVHQEEERTTILVTHSMEDALKYADHVIIMDHGKVYMEGPPLEIFKDQEALNNVGLDIPEVIQFLNKLESKFHISIPFRGQSVEQLGKEVAEAFKRGDKSE